LSGYASTVLHISSLSWLALMKIYHESCVTTIECFDENNSCCLPSELSTSVLSSLHVLLLSNVFSFVRLLDFRFLHGLSLINSWSCIKLS
jgi:hypothetical protein